jgi:siroheme synthase-like protein
MNCRPIEDGAMSLLPIFLKLEHRPGLLVGAGAVALEKISSLLKTGLRLRVVAPKAKAEVRQLATEGKLEWIERPFDLSDLDGNFMVIAATDSAEVNAAVYRGAVERGILVNSVDDPPQCDFYFGSVIERGRLQVAISTAGQSPAVAQRLRREIDEQLPSDLGVCSRNPSSGRDAQGVAASVGPTTALRRRLLPCAPDGSCASR